MTQRQPTRIKKTKKVTTKKSKGKESDFELPHYQIQMSSVSQNITKHTKKQENMSHLKVKNKWTIIIPEEVNTLDLLDKFCKATVLNMLKDLKENKDK